MTGQHLNLVHFSRQQVRSVRSVLEQTAGRKPTGLWVSVEGNGDGWSDWCRSEEYGDIDAKQPHAVTLAPGACIKLIQTANELNEFTDRYGERWGDLKPIFEIRWNEVADSYQGIIITPYLPGRAYSDTANWYYGWDCASGCIWDATAIQSVRVMAGAS